MTTNESKLTPAQKAMLGFLSGTDAHTVYQDLSTTLGLSIANFSRHYLWGKCF